MDELNEMRAQDVSAGNERLMRRDLAPLWREGLAPEHVIELGELDPDLIPPGWEALVLELEREPEESNVASIGGADLAPQHGIEQGEFDPDDLRAFWRWQRQNIPAGNERLIRRAQASGRIIGVEQSDSTRKSFMAYATESLRNLPSKQLKTYLGIFSVTLCGLTKTSTNQFDPFKVIKSRYTPEEAFRAYYPEVVHMTMFIISFIIIFIMVLPLRLRFQILTGMLLTVSTVFYLAMLWLNASASGVYVACGSLFKLPLIWFATLEAVGLSLATGLVILPIAYFGWKYIHKGNPRAVGVSFDGFMSLL
ncbi:uncharacterized protein LOC131609903 isoform X2 [Vicia villosa]|uniref:uncharacterized protein LOC131609903 isoform X2 n=1 Tax=Vicia villosa TaxID=3911 RepID=UPI00273BD4AF|nr:uncharacterized protein LOC131609903 isoform X2 [Vicia villosa]